MVKAYEVYVKRTEICHHNVSLLLVDIIQLKTIMPTQDSYY